jgi:hypothetical protein
MHFNQQNLRMIFLNKTIKVKNQIKINLKIIKAVIVNLVVSI